ncbi:hypothetical protein EQO05_06865 [Methanosarcina sp. MSH10X1]|nr:hypothetical protein EQO05_06865 [Methanosarcina sp. MSH10X1]
MRFDTLIRSFTIACLISLITVIIEAAYYGLQPENAYSVSNAGYSVTSPFVNNLSDLTSPVNLILLAIIFFSAFVVALSKISKNEKLSKRNPMRRYG